MFSICWCIDIYVSPPNDFQFSIKTLFIAEHFVEENEYDCKVDLNMKSLNKVIYKVFDPVF